MAFDPVTGIWAKSQAKKYTDAAIEAIGYGFNYKGSVATEADLPTTGNELGDVYTVMESGSEWVWTKLNGTNLWVEMGISTEDVPTQGSKKALSSGGAYTALSGKVDKTTKVNGHALSGDVTVTKADVELGNVDNTSDLDKPISTAAQTALDLKEDKANKVTSLSSASTDTQYPSAKLVKDQLDTKQDNLTSGTAINISNNTVSLKYDNDTIKVDANGKIYADTLALQPMKPAWEGSNLTTAQAAEMILDDPDTKVGDGFLGGVSWSDLGELGLMNAEVKAFVITSYIIQFEMTSADTEPYAWFYNSIGATWRSYVPIENSLTSTSTTQALSANQGKVLSDSLATHSSNTENPHSVTKAQVGLGNVDNTSDTDKPVSIAQQAALDLKQNITDDKLTTTDKTVTGAINEIKGSLVNYSLISETGNKVDLEIDQTNYQLTAKLYDKNDNLLSTSSVIDLPIEQLVVNVTYDAATKELVITLKNGTVTRVPIGSIISGLATEAWVNTNFYNKTEMDTSLGLKQNVTDSSLTTTAKTVVGAINELKSEQSQVLRWTT